MAGSNFGVYKLIPLAFRTVALCSKYISFAFWMNFEIFYLLYNFISDSIMENTRMAAVKCDQKSSIISVTWVRKSCNIFIKYILLLTVFDICSGLFTATRQVTVSNLTTVAWSIKPNLTRLTFLPDSWGLLDHPEGVFTLVFTNLKSAAVHCSLVVVKDYECVRRRHINIY